VPLFRSVVTVLTWPATPWFARLTLLRRCGAACFLADETFALAAAVVPATVALRMKHLIGRSKGDRNAGRKSEAYYYEVLNLALDAA
jgi:hypothetical protein